MYKSRFPGRAVAKEINFNTKKIKFRAWVDDRCCMYHNVGVIGYGDSFSIIPFDSITGEQMEPMYSVSHKIELMQYIGIKDQNHKEIYEGDIVKWHRSRGVDDIVGVIIYDAEFAAYRIGEHGVFIKPQISKNIEILGNIYENKELSQ